MSTELHPVAKYRLRREIEWAEKSSPIVLGCAIWKAELVHMMDVDFLLRVIDGLVSRLKESDQRVVESDRRLSAAQDQLQRIGRKAFWASKGDER